MPQRGRGTVLSPVPGGYGSYTIGKGKGEGSAASIRLNWAATVPHQEPQFSPVQHEEEHGPRALVPIFPKQLVQGYTSAGAISAPLQGVRSASEPAWSTHSSGAYPAVQMPLKIACATPSVPGTYMAEISACW
jgi:hypothetical protein